MAQAHNIGRHLNQLPRNSFCRQIENFTLQINHHQKFMYTAHRYFDVNMSLLSSVSVEKVSLKFINS